MVAPSIMLVDDEVTFVKTMAKRLETRNIEVITAFSGEECLEKLNTNSEIDVIVLDIKMPGMDGIETLRNIKKRAPLIEVLMLTGHASVEFAVDGMKLGAYDFLMKPSPVSTLRSFGVKVSSKGPTPKLSSDRGPHSLDGDDTLKSIPPATKLLLHLHSKSQQSPL